MRRPATPIRPEHSSPLHAFVLVSAFLTLTGSWAVITSPAEAQGVDAGIIGQNTDPMLVDAADLQPPPPPGAEPIDRIILRVNDEIVTLQDFEVRKAERIRGLLSDPRLDNAERQRRLGAIGQEIMQQVYRETLIASHARRAGYTVTERETDEAIRDVMAQQSIESQAELEAALADAGMTLDTLRESLRQELLIGQVIRRDVTGKIDVPDDEVRSYYRNNPDQFEIAERRKLIEVIVLEDSESGDLDQRANALRAQLQATDDPSALVDPLAENGVTTRVIDLGWLRRDELGEELADAAFALEPQTWSEPVEARGGLHLVYVEEIEEAAMQAYEDVENRIRARERQLRFGTQLRTFLAELEETSYIQEDLPPDAVGFRALGDDLGELERDDELEDFRAPVLPGDASEAAAEEAVEDLGLEDLGDDAPAADDEPADPLVIEAPDGSPIEIEIDPELEDDLERQDG